MQLKQESQHDARKKFSMRNKLRKASNCVQAFEKLVEVRERERDIIFSHFYFYLRRDFDFWLILSLVLSYPVSQQP